MLHTFVHMYTFVYETACKHRLFLHFRMDARGSVYSHMSTMAGCYEEQNAVMY